MKEVLCGSSENEGIISGDVNGTKKGAPDENSEKTRRWNVVKSVAETLSGDNLAKNRKGGYWSRGDRIAFGGSKGRGSEGVDLKDRIELRAEWSASLVYFQLLV